jgi:hypothetical protein
MESRAAYGLKATRHIPTNSGVTLKGPWVWDNPSAVDGVFPEKKWMLERHAPYRRFRSTGVSSGL